MAPAPQKIQSPPATAKQPEPSAPQPLTFVSIAQESPAVRDWQKQVSALKLKGIANEVLLNSVLLRSDVEGLQVALDPRLQSLYRPALLQQMEQALQQGRGEHFQVRFETPEAIDREASPAACLQRDEQRQRQQVLQTIEQEPLVQALQEHFGAELVESSLVMKQPNNSDPSNA